MEKNKETPLLRVFSSLPFCCISFSLFFLSDYAFFSSTPTITIQRKRFHRCIVFFHPKHVSFRFFWLGGYIITPTTLRCCMLFSKETQQQKVLKEKRVTALCAVSGATQRVPLLPYIIKNPSLSFNIHHISCRFMTNTTRREESLMKKRRGTLRANHQSFGNHWSYISICQFLLVECNCHAVYTHFSKGNRLCVCGFFHNTPTQTMFLFVFFYIKRLFFPLPSIFLCENTTGPPSFPNTPSNERSQ